MTPNEIVRSFLESADKRKQISVLAELNATSEQAIVDVLEQDGRVKTNMLHGWRISKSLKEARAKRNEERREQEKQMLAEAVHKKEMEMNSTPPPSENGKEAYMPGFRKLLGAYADIHGMKYAEAQRMFEDMLRLRDMAKRAVE